MDDPENVAADDVEILEGYFVRRRHHSVFIGPSNGLTHIPGGHLDCAVILVSNHLWISYEHIRNDAIFWPLLTMAFRNEFPSFYDPIEQHYIGNISNIELRTRLSQQWHDVQDLSINYNLRIPMSLDSFFNFLIPDDNNGVLYRFIFQRKWICVSCQYEGTHDHAPIEEISRSQFFLLSKEDISRSIQFGLSNQLSFYPRNINRIPRCPHCASCMSYTLNCIQYGVFVLIHLNFIAESPPFIDRFITIFNVHYDLLNVFYHVDNEHFIMRYYRGDNIYEIDTHLEDCNHTRFSDSRILNLRHEFAFACRTNHNVALIATYVRRNLHS
jgi:hypothetical protein